MDAINKIIFKIKEQFSRNKTIRKSNFLFPDPHLPERYRNPPVSAYFSPICAPRDSLLDTEHVRVYFMRDESQGSWSIECNGLEIFFLSSLSLSPSKQSKLPIFVLGFPAYLQAPKCCNVASKSRGRSIMSRFLYFLCPSPSNPSSSHWRPFKTCIRNNPESFQTINIYPALVCFLMQQTFI